MVQASLSSTDSAEASSHIQEPLQTEFRPTPASFLESLQALHLHQLRHLRLHGTDPTQHPDFVWMLTRLLEQVTTVEVHAPSLVPHFVVKKLEQLPAERVTLYKPLVLPGEVWPHQLQQQLHLFSRLGPRVLVGIDLLFTSVKLDYALKWIEQYQLARRVRLELRPQPQSDDAELVRMFGESVSRAQTHGVVLELDPPPGPTLELLPDGRVLLAP